MDFKIHKMEQRTEEWFEIRKFRLTASGKKAKTIATASSGLKSLVFRSLAEGFSSAEPEQITSKDIERGVRLEPIAKKLYELETGQKVEEIGFVSSGEFLGFSPDGFVGEDGMIEIKAPNDERFLSLMIEPDKDHIHQIQMGLLISGRKWCDYVLYNENFPHKLNIQRIERDEKIIEKLQAGLDKGVKLMEEYYKHFKELFYGGKNE